MFWVERNINSYFNLLVVWLLYINEVVCIICIVVIYYFMLMIYGFSWFGEKVV